MVPRSRAVEKLEACDEASGNLNVIVETPKGSRDKFKWDPYRATRRARPGRRANTNRPNGEWKEQVSMSIDKSTEQRSNALTVQNPNRYRAALEIARQLNAEVKPRRALQVFNALSKSEMLPVVAAVGTVGIAGLAAAIRVARQAIRRSQAHEEQQPPNRQLVVIHETAIYLRTPQVAIVSRISVIQHDQGTAHAP